MTDYTVDIVRRNYTVEMVRKNYTVEIQGHITNIVVEGGSTALLVGAGESIGGHKIVKIENGLAYLFDASNPADYGKAVGVTTGAVILGGVATIHTFNELVMPFPVVSGQPYYAGANGEIQTNEGSAISQKIGIGTSSEKIFVNLETPLLL